MGGIQNRLLAGVFSFVLCMGCESHGLTFVRRPFLQLGTPNRASVCWKLGAAASLNVRFGTDSANLNRATAPSPNATDACVNLEGLEPGTRYYYRVYTGSSPVGVAPNQYLVTSPPPGARKKYTFWLLGDFGVGKGHSQYDTFGIAALRVRDAFIAVNGSPHVDGMLMLGDISYERGSEQELNAGTFDPYYGIMSNSFTWPAMGNHETYTSSTGVPYLAAFNLPTAAQAGGAPSNSEYYYSWDYGNIHFIVLEFEYNRSEPGSAQYQWLEQDLQSRSSRKADWNIAYFHHTPYTCCHHNSEREGDLVSIRYNFLPLLEKYGVDLVFVGHSHNYERSYLLDGAYSSSGTNTSQTYHYDWYKKNRSRIIKDSLSGDPKGTGPYRKAEGAHKGTVYTVVGSGGKLNPTSGQHPLMRVKHVLQGSVLLQIEDSVATARFIDTTRTVRDRFQVIKTRAPTVVRPRKPLGDAVQPGFSRTGRLFRFAADNAVPMRIYSLDGALLFRETPRGRWEPGKERLPPGDYYYRYGTVFGKAALP
jgi:hypothetical protein